MITDFPSNPFTNMAGVQSFQFSPYHLILILPKAIDFKVSAPLEFYNDGTFLNGYSTVSQLTFNETSEKQDNGKSLYLWEVLGFTPGDDDILLPLMARMNRCKHIVKTLDHNNRMRLVGYKAPLSFDYYYTTGMVEGEDMKGYAFRFFSESKDPAPHYILG